MRYKELTVITTHKYADIAAAVLSENNYGGVAIWDAQDCIDLANFGFWDYADEDLFKKTYGQVYIRAYFYPDSDIEPYLDELKRLKNINDDFEYSVEVAIKDDSAYRDEWKKFFAPIELKKLAIVPPWLDGYKTDKPIVYINPSMAFGTGSHQTTKMCLDAMQDMGLKGKTVMDVGCGSGILGICALKLGAQKAIMLDNDQSAIKVAQENLEHNNMTNKAQIIYGTLDKVSQTADIILANITADVLISLKDLFYERLIGGGILVLGGIIDQRLLDLKKAYGDFGLMDQKSMDDWRCLIYKKG